MRRVNVERVVVRLDGVSPSRARAAVAGLQDEVGARLARQADLASGRAGPAAAAARGSVPGAQGVGGAGSVGPYALRAAVADAITRAVADAVRRGTD